MGFIDTLRNLAESITGKKKSEPLRMDTLGCPGTRVNRGIMAEEYNRDLNSTSRRYDVYDRMRKSDGVTSALLKALLMPIISAPYAIRPGGYEEEDKVAAAFLEHNLFEGTSNSWREHLREAFTFKPFGFSCFEKEHEKRDWIYTDEKGKEHVYKSMTCLKKLHFRSQRTMERWLFNPDGSFNGFHQKARDVNGKQIDEDLTVPDVVVFTNEKEGDNFEGVSDFRAGYKHYCIKENLYDIECIGLEKNGVGVWNAQEQDITSAAPVSDEDRKKQGEIVTRLQAHEEMGLVTPKIWKMECLRGEINTQAFQNAIHHHMTMLALSVLADFMVIGLIGTGGSRALVQPKIDNFEKSLMESIEVFCEVHNKYVAGPLLDHNFNNLKRKPALYCRGLSKEDLKTWAETIGIIASSSFLPPYPELSTHIAEKLDLPAPSKTDLINVRRKSNTTGQEQLSPSSLPPALRERSWRFSEEAGGVCGKDAGRELSEREKSLGLDEQGVIALREAQEKIEQAFLSKVKPVYAAIKKSLNDQSNKGVDSNDLAVPNKLRQQYKALLKDAYLNSERNGALSVRKEMKKAPGADMAAVLEAKAEEAASALADKDCQDLVYFARLEIARRIGRKKL